MEHSRSLPDLAISMYPDRCAPRAARYCVSTIERPAPELRDAVVLLTSELVSRAVRLHHARSHELFELRAWLRGDVARVELRAAREMVCAAAPRDDPGDDLRLMDILADRWSIDADERLACIWFEIDRRPGSERPGGRLRSTVPFQRLRDRLATATGWARPRRAGAPASAVRGRGASARSFRRRIRSHR